MTSKPNAVQVSVVHYSPSLRRCHCRLCGGIENEVSVLCEVTEGGFERFRICERCVKKHDGDSTSIDAALRTRAAEIIRDAAREVQTLFDLVGRLEVVDLRTWQTACGDAHDQSAPGGFPF
jgi:hypothetical protein